MLNTDAYNVDVCHKQAIVVCLWLATLYNSGHWTWQSTVTCWP